MAERVNTVEDAPFNAFHWRMVAFAGGSYFVDGYILTSIGVSLTLITPQFGLSAVEAGLIGAMALMGIFFGALGGGPLADKFGRRKVLTIDLSVFVVAAVLQIFVGGFLALFVLRLILGIAIGVDYAVSTPYMAESTPRKQRGQVLAAATLLWFLGAAVAYVVTARMLGLGEESWRWMLSSAAIPAGIVLLLRIGIPESPHWLLDQGRVEEARTAVKRIFGERARVEDIDRGEEGASGGFGRLLESGYLKRTVFASLLWLLQVTPLFAIYTFAPTLLAALGLGEGYLGSAVISILFFVGTLIAILILVNGWGRRPTSIAGFIAATVSFAVLAISGLPTWLVAASFIFYALVMGGAQVLQTVYPAELFPTEVRGTACGVAAAVSRIGAAVGTFLLPVGLATLGVSGVMVISAVLSALGIWLCVAWAPETKGKSLVEASSISDVIPKSGAR